MPTLPDNSAKSSSEQSLGPASSTEAGARPLRAPAKVYSVGWDAPDRPDQFPAVVYWRDWIMPQTSINDAIDGRVPTVPPNYGGQTGESTWAYDQNGYLCIRTEIKDGKDWGSFVFWNWGCHPCGQSKVSDYKEVGGGKLIIEDSSL